MESKAHFAGKARLTKILFEDGWTIHYHDGEISFSVETDLGNREYWPDILACRDDCGWVAFEVDGKKGHSTKRDLRKMALRDTEFLALDIKTVRISTSDLVGAKKQTDQLILDEMNWQLFKK